VSHKKPGITEIAISSTVVISHQLYTEMTIVNCCIL